MNIKMRTKQAVTLAAAEQPFHVRPISSAATGRVLMFERAAEDTKLSAALAKDTLDAWKLDRAAGGASRIGSWKNDLFD